MKARDFELPDQFGTPQKLSSYRGQWVVLYFYPKDETPGCTKEACSFRDDSAKLKDVGAIVLGISKDSVASHRKFADRHKLNFPILSDESKETIKAYDAWTSKKILGKTIEGTARKTYLIDPTGEIYRVYNNVNPLVHADQVLRDLLEANSV